MPIAFGSSIREADFRDVQNQLALDHYKWDTQIGDSPTLFRQPLLMLPATWEELSQMAEKLAAELMEAEEELLRQPELYAVLGLHHDHWHVFKSACQHGATPSAVRALRFDFHWTTEGWRISEVNSDVPGGYTEASCFTELMAAHCMATRPAGNPVKRWIDAMMCAVGERGHIALLSAPGFLEDQQVTAFLASHLHQNGVGTFLIHHPEQLHWSAGKASVIAGGKRTDVDAIVRFYQGEWLLKLPSSCGWKWLFSGGKTPVANSGVALLTESKRFPLAWNRLSSKLLTWRTLLPECRDPLESGWESGDSWVLKQTFSNTGDAVHAREWMDREAWIALCGAARKNPEHWVVQKRFETLPVESIVGRVYPCIGVYTINGRIAGAYVRVNKKQVVDYASMDVALLISGKNNVE